MASTPRKTLLSALISALVVTGCSDSGNNKKPSQSHQAEDSSSEQIQQGVAKTRIRGNVVKGRVSNAEINLYQVTDGTVQNTPFASAYTDSLGVFDLEIDSQNLSEMLYVEVLGAADGSTQMNCDALQCGVLGTIEGVDSNDDGVISLGETVRLSPEFTLSTVISKFKTTDDITVSVTPLTHFAAQQALATGSLTLEEVERQMHRVATVLNLPTILSQMVAIDPTESETKEWDGAEDQTGTGNGRKIDTGAFEYGLLSAAVAGMAARSDQTIEQAIESLNQTLYNDDGTVNRSVLVALLEEALVVARHIARSDESLLVLITDMQLLLAQYRCGELGDDSEACNAIEPPVPPVVEVNELDTVKAFVADFRGWARDIAAQSDPALSNFRNRLDYVDNVWEDDLKDLTSALNDLLPGIAQTLSPSYSFCYYCDTGGQPIYNSDGSKQLNAHGLQYLLHNDGSMNITGRLGEIEVDVDLLLPSAYHWDQTHSIEITAGRLSKGDMDLVLLEGSRVQANYEQGLELADIVRGGAPHYGQIPDATSLTVDANFFVTADYSVTPISAIGFESEEGDYSQVLTTNGWQVVSNKSASGSHSLRSARIGDGQSTRAVANFETPGGQLTFDYAVESEGGFDYLRVYVDGRQVLSESGYQPGFRSTSLYLSPGQHQVVWEYHKDGSVSSHQDAAWVDNIVFPGAAANAGFEALTTHTVLNGRLGLTAQKLKGPWHNSYKGYLPSEVVIDAHLGSDFSEGEAATGRDDIHFRLAANFTDLASFNPPEALEQDTLSKLGHYTVGADIFEIVLPHWQATIRHEGSDLYHVETMDANGLNQSYYQSAGTDEMHIAAGRLLENSTIGWHVVDPKRGLFVTTLLNASPWGSYEDSRFSPEGGDVFGYLVDTFNPLETNEQFLSFAASLEATFSADGFPATTVGTSLNRDSFNEGSFDLFIELEGKRFDINSLYWLTPASYGVDESIDLAERSFSISNQNGVELHLGVDEPQNGSDDGKTELPISGELIYNGKVYGTVERVKGVTLIRYVDGTGESLE